MFTLRPQPGATDEEVAADLAAISRDLLTLKQVPESS